MCHIWSKMILIESSSPNIWRSIDLRGLIHWHRVHSLIILSFLAVFQFFTNKTSFKHKPNWSLQFLKWEKNKCDQNQVPKILRFHFSLFLELFKYIIILKSHRFHSFFHFSAISQLFPVNVNILWFCCLSKIKSDFFFKWDASLGCGWTEQMHF